MKINNQNKQTNNGEKKIVQSVFIFLVLVKCCCYYCKKQRNEATLFECMPILCSIRSVSKCFPYESGDSINTFVAENVKRDRKTETSSSDSIQCGIWCAKCFYYIEKKKKKRGKFMFSHHPS